MTEAVTTVGKFKRMLLPFRRFFRRLFTRLSVKSLTSRLAPEPTAEFTQICFALV